jgi:type VI protein secretion system component Hcp
VQGSSTSKLTSATANELEEISFTFQKITVAHKQAATSGVDDWQL